MPTPALGRIQITTVERSPQNLSHVLNHPIDLRLRKPPLAFLRRNTSGITSCILTSSEGVICV